MAKDYYELLGVSKNATQDEIKRAYRKLAHQHHPDKKGGDEAKFKEINAAYQALGNPEKRKQYDQFGAAYGQPGAGGPGGGPGGFSWEDFARASGGGQYQQGGVDFDFGDIFGDLFGFGRRGGGAGGRTRRGGNDIQAEMTIDFRESAFGADKVIDLYKSVVCSRCSGGGAEPGTKVETCTTCGGSGRVEQIQRTILGAFRTVGVCPECRGEGKRVGTKCRECRGSGRVKSSETIKVKVPAGISDGETIRLSGKGEAGERGSGAGDLYITMRVKPDPNFERKEDDIVSSVDITFPQAALGDKIPILTLDGEVSLRIPAGTQSGKVFKLRDRGVMHLRSRGRGDHLVTVNVVTPTDLSRKQKKLLEEFGE
ncbi:MAG: molecular chaperone DnaJ [Patescibacteria group bacterium]